MLASLVQGTGCARDPGASDQPRSNAPSSPSTTGPRPPSSATATERSVRSLAELKDRCFLREHGLVIDLGSRAAAAYENFRLTSADPPQPVSYQGQSFRTLDQMSQDFVFWTQHDLPSFGFEALVHGRDSERLAVYVDGERLGAAQLVPDQMRVVRINSKSQLLTAGRHRLTLSLSRPRGANPSADIGWIRLGQPSKSNDDQPAARDQVFSEVTIGKDRQASIVVKPGALVSCPVWLPENTQLSLSVGVWGAGLAEGEVVVVDDQGKEHVVARVLREKDQKRDFEALTLDLSAYSSQLVDVVFRAQPHSSSPRLVFGTPQLSNRQVSAQSAPRARRAVVVVLSALGPRHTPPSSAQAGLPVLNQLAQVGTTYPHYRASSTSVTSVIASLLTGLAPYQHGLHDIEHKLPGQLLTLASAVEAAGGRSAFMTGVPSSSAEFGLDHGFESFSVVRPQHDLAATEPLRQAMDFLKTTTATEGPVLSIVHLRGAHPPFDISREGAHELPPPEYGGDFTPRRAAIQLAEVGRRAEKQQHLSEEDWTRVFAMEKAALLRQNETLERLVHWLRQSDLYEDTLLVVMGDVAPGERPSIPYGDFAPLDEPFLYVPLVVKYPRGHLGAENVSGLFAPRDVARTIATVLGLEFEAKGSDSIDLSRATASRLAKSRPHIAYRDLEYSMRLGSRLLRGADAKTPRLCFLEIDPACQIERSDQHPALVHALWLTAFSTLNPALKLLPVPEKLETNEELSSAFIVWGSSE